MIQREREQHAADKQALQDELDELREQIGRLSTEILQIEGRGEGKNEVQEGKGKGKAPEN
jgi:prefoldin subunit 5